MLYRTEKQILRSLLAKPATFWQLIKEQDGHLAKYVQLIGDMVQQEIIESKGDYLCLTEKGKKLVDYEYNLSPHQPVVCPTCAGKTITLQGEFSEVLGEFQEIVRDRPQAIAEYDQGYVDVYSTVARVALMYQRGDLEKRDVILFGDDDLTSIAVALTGKARKITVLEVDERLVEFIESVAKKKGWDNLTVKTYDVKNPLPEEFQSQYDTFLIDPVETLPGISLFLTRCAESLRGKGSAGYFGLTHLEASREKWHAIQKLLLDMNFAIVDIIHNFQEYELEKEGFITKNYPLVKRAFNQLPVPDVNWYTSNFIHLEAIEKPKVPETRKATLDDEFYVDDEAYATLPR